MGLRVKGLQGSIEKGSPASDPAMGDDSEPPPESFNELWR